MKLLRFVPVSQVGHIRHHGISVWRYQDRASGVYCYPIIGDRTAACHWSRALRRTTRKGNKVPRLAAVVFEISDDELIYFFKDFIYNSLWEEGDDLNHALIPAREAQHLAVALARKNAEPLTAERFEQLMEEHGQIAAEEMPFYGLGDLEIVVPRPIQADEIIKIEIPPESDRNRRRRQRVSEEDEDEEGL